MSTPSPEHPAPAEDTQWQDLAMRTRAELENFKKRVERDREQDRISATQALVEDLIPILDTLLLAHKHNPSEEISRTLSQLQEVLSARGLILVAPQGGEFDPATCEVLEQVGEGTSVVEVLRPGWILGTRLVRPALVRVG